MTKPARKSDGRLIKVKKCGNSVLRREEPVAVYHKHTHTVPAVMMPVGGTGTTVILCEDWDGCACSCFSVLAVAVSMAPPETATTAVVG